MHRLLTGLGFLAQKSGPPQRPFIFIWYLARHLFLKEPKKGEPYARPFAVNLFECSSVGKSMVVKEETRRNVKSNNNINGIMLMGSQDEENSKHIQDPAACVQVVHVVWCVCKEKNVAQIKMCFMSLNNLLVVNPHLTKLTSNSD